MNIKNWKVAELNKERAVQLAEQYEVPTILAMLLDIRGYVSEEEIETLLYQREMISDPFLMKDMDIAIQRIQKAIDTFEKIAIYGDYDADGITATAILYSYLGTVGADVVYYIPQREGEGYGMNISAVETLAEKGINLIITVDNGIASVEEVKRANELGMDVVVTDHHQPHEELPEAVAVVDPHRGDCESPFKDLCGAGVVLKLIIALEGGDEDAVMAEYGDFAALGTIGDVMPIKGENRAIIRAGVDMLAESGKPGIQALISKSGCKDFSARSLAFTVIPRINATGRMGSADRAVKLLCCDFEEEAMTLAEEICEENDQRKNIEAGIIDEAIAKIYESEMQHDRVLVVSGKNWHHGVVGIVAARITDLFGKPSIIISESDDEAKGSGRSVEGFSLFEAISHCKELMVKFGGHPMAAGVTLKPKDIEEFRIKINKFAQTECEEMPTQSVALDCKLNPAALSVEMPADLLPLEPFGPENPSPVFGLYGMSIENIAPVGGGGHLRINLMKKGRAVSCMRFGVRAEDFPYAAGDVVDLAVSLDAKEFRGNMQLTIAIRDIKHAKLDLENCIHTYRLYEKLKRKETFDKESAARITPSREELVEVYRFIAAKNGEKIGLMSMLNMLKGEEINLGKLLVCFEIFAERGLAACDVSGEQVTIGLAETNGSKINIFESSVFEEIQTLTK